MNDKPLLKSLQTNNKSSSDIEIKSEKRRKCRYKQLEFLQSGSSKGSSVYVTGIESDQQKNHITVIPETDTEGEGDRKEEIPPKKISTMAERYLPKVKLTDPIVLYLTLMIMFESNVNCIFVIVFFRFLLFHPLRYHISIENSKEVSCSVHS